MSKISEAIANFNIFEGDHVYYGMASATMPTIQNVTEQISGAGIAGSYETAIMGHINAMTLTLNFRNMTTDSLRLMEQRNHQIELRVPVQELNRLQAQKIITAYKHVMIIQPKSLNAGQVAPATVGNVSGEYSVQYWATYINGEKVLEIDMLNFIYEVNGTNYLADMKRAMGM
ncbi:MAG: phage major tail tube protein [Oscillospiraceae bacterium]|nr:phage major tail tube protein [Oscillospiraceae bacterium]